MRKAKTICAGLALLLLLSTGWALGTAQNSPPPNQAATSKTSAAPPSASEIAAARTSHKVWVNLDTGIYHRGGRWYGKTKNGKFMTVDDAKKAGYKPAKRD
ncbi:MAG: hypothetical protein WAL32_13140 [Terriglobales bacterium]